MAQSFVSLKKDFSIDKDVYDKLYPHQRQGIQWMWDFVHLGGPKEVLGGLLSDDMGLGKTIQVAAFISALIDMEEAKHFLLIVPTSLIPNWESELHKWVPNVDIYHYTGDLVEKKRLEQLAIAQKRTSILIATYGVMRTSAPDLNKRNGRKFTWDYTILDEAHYIKNVSSQQSEEIFSINSDHRLLLTGTPIMNTLKDFHTLVWFFSKGKFLCKRLKFIQDFEIPIEAGRTKCAKPKEVKLANELSEKLRKETGPWILRRTKQEVQKATAARTTSAQTSDQDIPEVEPLKEKNDFVLWCKMTDSQLKIYTDFLESVDVKEILNSSKTALDQCTVLKKICDHPRRMSNRACQHVGLIDKDQKIGKIRGKQCAANKIKQVPVDVLLAESGKLRVFSHLVDVLDEKMLVFSQSIKILDIIEKVLKEKEIQMIRMDGRDNASERDEKVKNFQKRDSKIKAFLLTTGVGSVGLTLTAATRVIVFDPDWNPGKDDQAVDRAYRIGQTKPVVVFRLITCETIEEKIYRRQIFKKSIISQNNGEIKDPFRYFDNKSIRDLFIPPINGAKESETQKQLEKIKHKRRSYPALNNLLKKVESFRKVHAGIHDHNLVFDMENSKAIAALSTVTLGTSSTSLQNTSQSDDINASLEKMTIEDRTAEQSTSNQEMDSTDPSAGRKLLRRRSQLPIRPETDDEDSEISESEDSESGSESESD